ncbi:hypothetical protein AB0M46_51300, partial [Dactylosporangium sp. NPDC051485]|uniref:hypothetical protein n=1 Tax=Dactylosporangium sp. NPDC051485 TaxID=3154846 RepID=UPI0034411D0F
MASAPLTLTAAAAVLLGGPPLGLSVPAAVLLAAAACGVLHAAWLVRLAVGEHRPAPAPLREVGDAAVGGGGGRRLAV